MVGESCPEIDENYRHITSVQIIYTEKKTNEKLHYYFGMFCFVGM